MRCTTLIESANQLSAEFAVNTSDSSDALAVFVCFVFYIYTQKTF